jgi:hypothetical protein
MFNIKPNKYNDGRAVLKLIGVRPPNFLAPTVYRYLERRGYEWNGTRWLTASDKLREHAQAMSDPYNF